MKYREGSKEINKKLNNLFSKKENDEEQENSEEIKAIKKVKIKKKS